MTNCLITKRGKIVNCGIFTLHTETCEHKLGLDLDVFLISRGGVRISTAYRDIETLAIEYYSKPTEPQMRVIRRILRNNDYYTVMLNLRTISRFRPIRGFQI